MIHFNDNMGCEFMAEYYGLFKAVVYNSKTLEDFEVSWEEALETSGEVRNAWLQKKYNNRHNWVPAFVSHIFSSGLQSSQRVESSHSFFKKFFQLRNTLLEFIIRFEAGLRAQRFSYLRVDLKDKDTAPTMKTPLKIETVMARKYTLVCLRRY